MHLMEQLYMSKKTYRQKILIFIILSIGISSLVFAGPIEEKDITLHFQIPLKISSQGEWKMYLISIGEFDKSNWSFDEYSYAIIKNYTYFKENCGEDNTFYETIYKMSEEEKKHKGCVINGTYQEEYCFKTITDKAFCTSLTPYKINDKHTLDFGSYYNSYMWDIARADFYNHFELSQCGIINDSCSITIHKASTPYNPYITVLERLNSTDEVYFSDNIHIAGVNLFYNESLFACGYSGCDVNFDLKIDILKFTIVEPHTLVIEFSNQSEKYNPNLVKEDIIVNIDYKEKTNLFDRLKNWLKSIIFR